MLGRPSRLLRHWPMAVSHSRTVLSLEADATSWKELEELDTFMQPFYEITLDKQWDNSTIDQAISSMDFLVCHYQEAKDLHLKQGNAQLVERIIASWNKFDKYYKLSDHTPIYAAAILLHPALRRRYLDTTWASYSDYIQPAVTTVKDWWMKDYKPSQTEQGEVPLSKCEQWKRRIYRQVTNEDEFDRFTQDSPHPIGTTTALMWWLEASQREAYPHL